MLSRRLAALLLTLAPLFAQESPYPEEQAIRLVLQRYERAVRNADEVAVKAETVAGAKSVTPGGTAARPVMQLRSESSPKNRSTLLRRVDVLSSTVAVATAVWRAFDAPPPFDVGTLEYVLLRGDAGWQVAHSHSAFLPGPPEHRIAALDPDPPAGANPDGWVALFDGKSFDGWVTAAVGVDPGAAWRIADGALVTRVGGTRSGLLTRARYRFYELEFEWMAAKGSNSGVKYRLLAFDRIGASSAEPLGAEYQIADDDGDAGARVDPRQRSGALYSAIPVERSEAAPLGEWNQGRIVVAADHVEHWLNGKLTARYEPDISFASAIALQHHTTEVRFRNIRIRPR